MASRGFVIPTIALDNAEAMRGGAWAGAAAWLGHRWFVGVAGEGASPERTRERLRVVDYRHGFRCGEISRWRWGPLTARDLGIDLGNGSTVRTARGTGGAHERQHSGAKHRRAKRR